MALRGVKPESIQKRLKAFFYGSAGVGKTMASIQFPKPYLIDTEKGAENDQYIKALEKSGGVIFQTSDFEELLKEINTLLSEKHDYKTLIIDPLTNMYHDLLDKFSKEKTTTKFANHYLKADNKIKHLLSLLIRLDMNVIITSHSKNQYGENLVILGQTFDCYKKLDHVFDLVFEVQKRGKERVGIVKKSRVENFQESDVFPFCYEEISKRYGKEVLERDSIPEKLATKEQINELVRLIELMKITEETSRKWLKKANSEKWEEMPFYCIKKCIDYLKSKIKGETK